MTAEQMEKMLDTLGINEVTLLAKLANDRKAAIEQVLIRDAEAKFIEAYKAFRALAPSRTKYLCWEYDNNDGNWEEQDFDLYNMLDTAIGEGLF